MNEAKTGRNDPQKEANNKLVATDAWENISRRGMLSFLYSMSIMPQSLFRNALTWHHDVDERSGIDIIRKNENIKIIPVTRFRCARHWPVHLSSQTAKCVDRAQDSTCAEEVFYDCMVANYPTYNLLALFASVPSYVAIEIGFIGDNVDTLEAFTQGRSTPEMEQKEWEKKEEWGGRQYSREASAWVLPVSRFIPGRKDNGALWVISW